MHGVPVVADGGKLRKLAGWGMFHAGHQRLYPVARGRRRLCRAATTYHRQHHGKVANQFRIGLYPYIQKLYAYFALTSAISGSATNSSTINYAAANLATLLDTGQNATLGSGGTHFENAFPTMNSLVTSVGTGSTATDTLPFVFLVTDGAQNNQTQWGGDGRATITPLW